MTWDLKVKMFGLNRMDISQREGGYPVPPGASSILGVEFSGTVAELGPDVGSWKEGDEVFGLTYGGAYAEYVLVDAGRLLPKPQELSWEEAAAIPEAWLTAYQNLFLSGELKKGESVLIHAGASGVGIAAIQLAKLSGAEHVITTAGSEEKLNFLKSMPCGPTDTINYKTGDFAQTVKEATDGKGVNLIIDFIGKDYWNKNIESLALDGRMVHLAVMSGDQVPDFSLRPILYKRLTIRGSTLRARSLQYQNDLIAGFNKDFVKHIVPSNRDPKEGGLRSFVHDVFKWNDIQAAHREMEANKNTGKIVVEIV